AVAGLPVAGSLLHAIHEIVSLAIIGALFAEIYRILPDARIAWRDVWVGAGITAVLFEIGKFLIGFYLGKSSVASAYGAAGSLVLVVVWIYYASMILLAGAELTYVWTEARRNIRPEPGALRVETIEKSIPPSGRAA